MEKNASEALDDFLEVLRREFRENPEFAMRAVKALGGKIEFRGENAANLVNPLEMVERDGAEGASKTLQTFSSTELRKIAKNHNLATAIDMKGLTLADMVDLLVRRAAQKIGERRA